MKYKFLLFDADGTILDFDSSEAEALQRAFEAYSLPFDDNILAVYRKHNSRLWSLFEQGKVAKPDVLVNRFADAFSELGFSVEATSVARLYERFLQSGFHVVHNAESVLKRLQGSCNLYLASNGVAETQRLRMAGSGLDKYFLDSFISEQVGCPKPQKAYFDYCFAHIPNFQREQTVIIGDSLSSDIAGGANGGIDTCWYNPKHKANTSNVTPTYEIDDLEQLFDIFR